MGDEAERRTDGETMGARIRKMRKARGLTQAQLAKKVGGTDQGRISEWESDKTEMMLSSLRAVAEALGCSTDYLLGISDEPLVAGEAARRLDDIRRIVEGRRVIEWGPDDTRVPDPRRKGS